ncbi:polysaccharide biosynthesis/export family protein [Sphingorhabdus lacus]|jgi:polysaccharide export outer membrane protein|uniref:Sugar transporter n=1 Tax=Sphingorhabdus lacus TaxID=392610 RepID=A0A6I6LI34_9SPHN|nr:polysaccharide biosynthesis/export family protein [Sphingorhabdus lacus]QGY82023.1 sugar transporter [Sphingorhabdus lacus]
MQRALALFCVAAFALGVQPVCAMQRAAPQGTIAAATNLPVYRINPGDELEIHVWREEQLQRVVKILPDGTFSYPLVGVIKAAGKTSVEVEKEITAGLVSQYFDGKVPNVTVSVRNPSGLQFSVIGKVKSTGTFTPGRYVTLLEALSFAGGTDEFANLDNIVVVRKTAGGLVMIKAKLADILRNRSVDAETAKNILMIESGDTVIVP